VALLALLMSCAAAAQDTAARLDFRSALELAQQSPRVILAEGQYGQAHDEYLAAFASLSAELRAGYVQTLGQASPAGTEPSTFSRGRIEPFTLSATLNVLPFGPAADGRARAEWRLTETEHALRDARQQATVDAARNYLAALRANQELELGEATVVLASLKLEAATVRAEAGAASPAQVLDAELTLSQAQNTLGMLIRQQAQALAALGVTLGTSVSSVHDQPRVSALLLRCHVDAGGTNEANPSHTDLLKAHHAVLQAELALLDARRQAGVGGSLSLSASTTGTSQSLSATALIDTRTHQPALSLSYDPGLEFGGESAPSGSRSGAASSSVALAVSVSIPLDGRSATKVTAAERSLQQALLQLNLAEQQVRLDSANLQLELDAATAAVHLNQQVLAARQASLETALQRLELGLIPELDVLQARHNLESTELTLARAQDALLLAVLQQRRNLTLDSLECLSETASGPVPDRAGRAAAPGPLASGNTQSGGKQRETH
jgi:outer membrane protein TolC